MLLIVILLVEWGLVVVPLAMFLSVLFSSTRTATLVTYLIVIMCVIFCTPRRYPTETPPALM
jgi:hypothetical protein